MSLFITEVERDEIVLPLLYIYLLTADFFCNLKDRSGLRGITVHWGGLMGSVIWMIRF